jgi:hypothetical protein
VKGNNKIVGVDGTSVEEQPEAALEPLMVRTVGAPKVGHDDSGR